MVDFFLIFFLFMQDVDESFSSSENESENDKSIQNVTEYDPLTLEDICEYRNIIADLTEDKLNNTQRLLTKKSMEWPIKNPVEADFDQIIEAEIDKIFKQESLLQELEEPNKPEIYQKIVHSLESILNSNSKKHFLEALVGFDCVLSNTRKRKRMAIIDQSFFNKT